MTLQAVAEKTKLPARTVLAIEAGRLHDLPRNFYGRAYVRMYAETIGLGESPVVRNMVDAIPASDVVLKAIVECREAADPPRPRTRTAALVDAAIVTMLSACGVFVCVAITRDAGWDLEAMTIAFVTLAAPTLVLYFGLLGATGVGTAGACLFRVDFVPGVIGPIDGRLLLRRTCQYLHSEAVALIGKPVRSCP